MKRGEFINNILKRYSAFYREIVAVNSKSHLSGLTFLWDYDTAFPNRPIFNVDDELFDYSGLLKTDVTIHNYKNFINDSNIKSYNISDLSNEHAEEIMKNNVMAIIRLENMLKKAEMIKMIDEE